jgi:hypothetical protein
MMRIKKFICLIQYALNNILSNASE